MEQKKAPGNGNSRVQGHALKQSIKVIKMQESIYNKIRILQEKLANNPSQEEREKLMESFNEYIKKTYSIKTYETIQQNFWKTFIHSLMHLDYDEEDNND